MQCYDARLPLLKLQRVLQVKPKVQLPTWHQLRELSDTFGPASLIYVLKSLCYMMLQVSCLPCHALDCWSVTPLIAELCCPCLLDCAALDC